MDTYKVKKLNHPINLEIAVPGSKSITNRALFLAALGNEAVHLKGVLFSEDSRYFLSSLKSLGFSVEIREEEKEVIVGGCGGMNPKERSRNLCGKCRNGSSFSNGDAGTFRRSLYHTGIGADEAQTYAPAL